MANDQPRAGLLRRSFAILLDFIIVVAPVQIIVAVLFAATAGHVQLMQGLTLTHCVATGHMPDNLNPPPPAGANWAKDCRVTFFGAEIARTLTVGHIDRPSGTASTSVSVGVHFIDRLFGKKEALTDPETYTLDREGKPIRGAVALDWLAYVVLFGYLVWTESRTGRSLGDRAMGIVVIDTAAAGNASWQVPAGKMIIRYLALMAGLLPLADLLDTQGLEQWSGAADLIAALWYIINVVQILRRRDPPYDRIAGTAVVDRVELAS
jgi:RDD family